MDPIVKKKAVHLINRTRVMTLAVSNDNTPWSSPVYFVFYKGGFYFLSNKKSRHIRYAIDNQLISASIFHDADQIDEIFGFQMSGFIEESSGPVAYFKIVKAYVKKFGFLEKIFGAQIFQNHNFFKEKFKSRLYGFYPDIIYLSDNSKPSGKRSEILLSDLADL